MGAWRDTQACQKESAEGPAFPGGVRQAPLGPCEGRDRHRGRMFQQDRESRALSAEGA